jgi:protein involved in polysaccharide export with SLBB domain
MLSWLRKAIVFGFVAALLLSGQTGALARSTAGASVASDYRLGAADKVRVTVFGEDKLGGEFQVGADGAVALPLIGNVAALGLTPLQFQTAVSRALAEGFLKDPKVSVEVLTYRPYYILGEVKKPGEYPYTNNLTVLNAAATAEGFTYRANTKKVHIKRANSSVEETVPLSASTMVAPGDTVRIGERYF